MPAKKPVPVDDGWRIPDALWERIEVLLPEIPAHPKGGRPYSNPRQMMDGIFYVLRTGCQWKAIPRCFGPGSTVHDWFQRWNDAGVFERLWEQGLLEFDENVGIDWQWQSMDGAMTKAPLGGKKNRPQPDRSSEDRRQTLAVDRGPRCSYWPEHRRRKPARHEDGGGHLGQHPDTSARADAGVSSTYMPGQGV